MNCKYCGAEVEAEAKVCPACGKSLEEKVSVGKIVAATAIGVVLLVLLAVMVIYGITGELPYLDKLAGSNATSEPTETVASTTAAAGVSLTAADLGMTIENITDFSGLFVSDEQMAAAADTVVAKVGKYELTNSVLQISFWMELYSFVNSNSSYLSYYGLDLYQPLDQQVIMGSEITWEQYFLDVALESWHRYAAVLILAEEAGFEYGEELEQTMTMVKEDLVSMAESNNFATVTELLAADMGAGATEEAYEEYMRMYYASMSYLESVYEGVELTREEVEAYFDAHASEIYSQYGITKDSGMMVDVRHVLIQPEGATADSYGHITATEEQWEACRAEGQKLLDDWVAAGATEEGFAEMAGLYSLDGGSSTTGGLYEGVTAGQMVENFNNWLFEEERNVGDYGLVRTEFGYHLMYYVGGDETWYIYGKDLARSGYLNDMVDVGLEANPLEVYLDQVVLSQAKALIVEEEVPETTGAAQ